MNNSIKRLQGTSPGMATLLTSLGMSASSNLQDLYLHRLSSMYHSRPKGNPANPMSGGIAPNTMRAQQHFVREVLNRAQIVLIEFNYRTDVAARTGDIAMRNPIAGAGVAGVTLTANYDGTNTITNTAGEVDSQAWTGDGNYEITVTGATGDYTGKRRVTWPETFPHAGADKAGTVG